MGDRAPTLSRWVPRLPPTAPTASPERYGKKPFTTLLSLVLYNPVVVSWRNSPELTKSLVHYG